MLALHVEVIASGIGDVGINHKSRPGIVSLWIDVRIKSPSNGRFLDWKESRMHALDDTDEQELGMRELAIAVGFLEGALDERQLLIDDGLVLVFGDTIAEEEDLIGQFTCAWSSARQGMC